MSFLCLFIKFSILNGIVSQHPPPPPNSYNGNVLEDIIVSMRSSTIPTINSINMDLPRDDLATLITQKLKTFSAQSQSPVVSMLQKSGVDFQSYWITNQIFIKGASLNLINSIRGFPEVLSVAKEELFPLNLVTDSVGTKPKGIEWHLRKMEVHKIWRKTKGEGIIVAAIDTGARATHEALKGNYIGTENFGWYDPVLFTKEPNDIGGHGTHVIGTIAGSGGIGAAPKAKWMACRAGLNLLMHEHAIIACAQFVLCPSDPSGESKCKNVPHIVSNSWGKGGGHNYFLDAVTAWIKAGIKPFFAVGNEGPKCMTAGSPADYDAVIAVGNTNINDTLHGSSSRGPVIAYAENENGNGFPRRGLLESIFLIGREQITTDKIKPNIVAPGVEINSAFILTDKSYMKLTGTSMATPGAAGVAALLLSINPKMTLKELKNLLYSTTDKNLTNSNNETCGNIPNNKFPNNLYGHGRVNAYKAYKKLELQMKIKNGQERTSSNKKT